MMKKKYLISLQLGWRNKYFDAVISTLSKVERYYIIKLKVPFRGFFCDTINCPVEYGNRLLESGLSVVNKLGEKLPTC